MGGFYCRTRNIGQCVSSDKVCNGISDCDDGTDEDPRLCQPGKPIVSSWPM